MNNEQKQVIRKEIEEHVAQISSYKETAKRDSDMSGIKRLLQYMESSTASKNFFDNVDVDDLMAKYEEELIRVSKALGNSTFPSKQKMLNFLEYIRINGMYENIDMRDFFMPQTVAAISQSGINIALLGKGVCASQARFLRDLLLTSGEEAITKKVYFIDEDGIIEDQHLVTYACSSNNGTNFFLDPTWYNGTINSLEGSFNSADISEQHRSLLSILDVTQEEIESARNKVQEYLIERFQIKDISTQLGIDKASDLDKQIRMLTFMEKHLSPASGSLNCRSVVLGDREIECGKLLELFYKANNIPYILKCSGDKYNSAYITTIDGMESTIYPKVAFFSDRNNNSLSRKLHFAKNKKDENQYLWAFSDERRQQFMTSINKSRKIAATVIVPGQKLDTNLTTNRQFADTLKVDVSPVENSENTPAAVTQVVTHNDTTLGSDE
ncbi:MAG: hypothetical protein ACLUF5_06290 [Clostridia bacterium]|jgi:hypothetical protein